LQAVLIGRHGLLCKIVAEWNAAAFAEFSLLTERKNQESWVRGTLGMIELEQEDPIPQGDLALQITALPRETNGFGDIFGGWLVSQMDLAGTAMASRVAGGRVATVAIDRMAFLVPVAVGAQLSFYTQTLEIGRSSIKMMVEVWSDDPLSSEWRKVTEAVFVFVAIDGSGRTRSVPARR
jgi:acyl-CoA thioesterase YciA